MITKSGEVEDFCFFERLVFNEIKRVPGAFCLNYYFQHKTNSDTIN